MKKLLVWTLPLFSFFTAVACAQPPFSRDWPSFRGGTEMRGVAPCALPRKMALLWSRDTDSSIEATAAIVDGRTFVGTDDGDMLALRLADGKRLWKFHTEDAISSSPCFAEDTLFFGDEEGIFHALNATTGKEKWRFETDDKIISSPVVADGKVLFGSYDNHLYCLDARAGKKLWAFETDAQEHCAPCVAEGTAIIAGCDGKVRMIDLKTGKERAHASIGSNLAASLGEKSFPLIVAPRRKMYGFSLWIRS
jgi:outer membrane protein assembly factor BamB